jgi:hypothetical protein
MRWTPQHLPFDLSRWYDGSWKGRVPQGFMPLETETSSSYPLAQDHGVIVQLETSSAHLCRATMTRW